MEKSDWDPFATTSKAAETLGCYAVFHDPFLCNTLPDGDLFLQYGHPIVQPSLLIILSPQNSAMSKIYCWCGGTCLESKAQLGLHTEAFAISKAKLCHLLWGLFFPNPTMLWTVTFQLSPTFVLVYTVLLWHGHSYSLSVYGHLYKCVKTGNVDGVKLRTLGDRCCLPVLFSPTPSLHLRLIFH